MSGSYNLRSLQKKKNIPLKNCYLQNYSYNLLPDAFNPKVCLERLKLLECHNVHSSGTYLEKDRISVKKSKSFIMMNKKYLLKLFCIMILVVTSVVYWKDFLHRDSITAVKKFSEIFPEFQNLYFDVIKFHFYDSESNYKEKKTDTKNKKSAISKEKFTLKNKNSHIKKLIRNYLIEIKSNEKKQRIKKLYNSFIEEQCSANSTQNLNLAKNYTHKSTFFDLGNLADYALESQGAKIVTVFNTELYGTLTVKFLNFSLWPEFTNFLMKYFKCFSSNGPNSILIPWKKPGDCWAFKGSYGRVQIQLSEKIIIRAISIDHLPKEVAHNEGIQSAPKKFSVVGIEETETQINRMHWGTYEYKSSGPATQTFFIQPQIKVPFRKIEVIIESNHGNRCYTCVYKIRVHGDK